MSRETRRKMFFYVERIEIIISAAFLSGAVGLIAFPSAVVPASIIGAVVAIIYTSKI